MGVDMGLCNIWHSCAYVKAEKVSFLFEFGASKGSVASLALFSASECFLPLVKSLQRASRH